MSEKQGVFQQIADGVGNSALVFPTHVQVGLRLREALGDPDCHVEAAARLVQAEPLLAARVVAMANSVAYNPLGREISDLRTAISRLGFATVRNLTMALITRQMAGTAVSGELAALAENLWEHTAHVAALARVLARRVTGVDPEAALFAGIIHEVAGFYLLSQGARHPELFDDDFAAWIDGGERLVGEAVLGALGVPEAVREAIGVYWEGYLGMPPRSLGDTLLLAEELAPVASPLHRLAAAPARSDAELELLVGDVPLSEILEESQGEVESLRAALRF